MSPAFAPKSIPRTSVTSEMRFARWDEFDFDKSLWHIPAQRKEIEGVRYSYPGMKMKEAHIVPLSRQALVL